MKEDVFKKMGEIFKPEDTKIGLKIQYNNDITATVINETRDYILILTDKGSTYCVVKNSIDWQKQVIDDPKYCDCQYPIIRGYEPDIYCLTCTKLIKK